VAGIPGRGPIRTTLNAWRDRLRRPLTSSHSHGSGACGKDGANGRPIGSTCAAAPLTSSAALTRNQIRFPGTHTEVPVLTEPTPAQREAFTLIEPRIPLTLAQSNQRRPAPPSPGQLGIHGLQTPQLRLRPRVGQEIRLLPDAVRPALLRT
jgi:hypothetical protein